MSDSQFAALLFVQLAIILLVCRIVGLIGPSCFGWIAPDLGRSTWR